MYVVVVVGGEVVGERREAAELYRKGDRTDLADKEDREAEIVAEFLPGQVGEDEIRAAVTEFVAAEGLSGPRGIGPVMKAMIARFGAGADGAVISRIAREILTG